MPSVDAAERAAVREASLQDKIAALANQLRQTQRERDIAWEQLDSMRNQTVERRSHASMQDIVAPAMLEDQTDLRRWS
eukprot:SAG31_NODE_754_length_12324_cov_3.930061_7_plen_78_part_00